MITFRMRGTVKVAETGVGLSGLFVKAYDKDILFDDLLGSAYTKEEGRFEIISEPDDFRDFFEVKPDIYLKIYSPDAETLLYTTEKSVRWQAGRLEEFDVRIPRDCLGGLVPEGIVHLLDDNGDERSNFDVGESLTVQIEGVKAQSVYDLVLINENGEELFTSSLLSNRSGAIEPTTIWPQFGLDDPHSTERFSVERAQEHWQGRALRLEVRTAGKKVLEQVIRFADVFTRPLLLSTDNDGVVLNGFEVGERDAVVSGYNLPFHDTVRVFMVARQHDWLPGNSFTPVQLVSGRPAIIDLQIEGTHRNFRSRIARARELQPGAYDFIVRQLRYGYEDDEDLVLRSTDLVTRSITGLVVREKFMPSKAVLGGCANIQQISGRSIAGPPYFQYADTFQVGESIYAALDPAALDPSLISKMVALYVVKRPVANYQSLQHLPVLGGNSAVKKVKTQSSCINYNKLLIWSNSSASDVGEYDIVADFGNNTGDATTFSPNASYDQPHDFIDGYFTAGFRIVPDPTTDTDPNIAHYGTWSYTETDYGSKTVLDDGGFSVTVPMKAYVRFPADSAGVTDPLQISAAYANYPMIVVVHGAGHNYGNYDYLLSHWARNGFIATSIHLSSMNGTGRARILFEHLTILKNKFGSKAANNIGIMGHSRGGEAVVIAARLNQLGSGLGHNINAIISLAPTDQYTNEILGGAWATPYFVLYGAMDGDVAGGSGKPWNTGFALYDRASGAKKSMVFVYGATHDRFNLINPDVDLYFGKIGSTDLPKLLSAATHQTIAKAYMTAFFRWQLKNQSQWEGIFKGEWIPAAVAQAEPGKAAFYVQYSDTTTIVVDDFEEAHTPTSWQDSTIAGSVDDSNTLPVDPVEDELYDVDLHSPHDTSGLLLRWDGTSDKLEFKPDDPINVTAFNALSFRVTQKVDSGENLPNQIQDMYVTLTDDTSPTPKSRSIKISKFGEIPPPQKRDKNQYTKSAMCTIRIPLHVFTIEVINTDKVNLQNITALTFEFKVKPKGEIEIDSVEFTN